MKAVDDKEVGGGVKVAAAALGKAGAVPAKAAAARVRVDVVRAKAARAGADYRPARSFRSDVASALT